MLLISLMSDRYTNAVDMEDAIQNMNFPNGRTNTSGGLRTLRQDIFVSANGDRPNVRNVVIVMTDGVPTVEADKTLEEARLLREQSNAEVVVIGVTDSVNTTILRQISSDPQEEDKNWFVTPDFDSLVGLVKDIAQTACQTQAPVTTTPTPKCGCPVCHTSYYCSLDALLKCFSSAFQSLQMGSRHHFHHGLFWIHRI